MLPFLRGMWSTFWTLIVWYNFLFALHLSVVLSCTAQSFTSDTGGAVCIVCVNSRPTRSTFWLLYTVYLYAFHRLLIQLCLFCFVLCSGSVSSGFMLTDQRHNLSSKVHTQSVMNLIAPHFFSFPKQPGLTSSKLFICQQQINRAGRDTLSLSESEAVWQKISSSWKAVLPLSFLAELL